MRAFSQTRYQKHHNKLRLKHPVNNTNVRTEQTKLLTKKSNKTQKHFQNSKGLIHRVQKTNCDVLYFNSLLTKQQVKWTQLFRICWDLLIQQMKKKSMNKMYSIKLCVDFENDINAFTQEFLLLLFVCLFVCVCVL
jgi:hypothetical protein